MVDFRKAYSLYRSRGLPAWKAWAKAKEGGARISRRRVISYNPRLDKPFHGEYHVRWVENVAESGLRFVGYADEIAGLNHTGWWLDDDGFDESMRGVVYRLPARKGKERFVYGYADPWNDGCALLSFDPCDDKMDAAYWADQFAERCAEDERNYQRGSADAMRYSDLGETLASDRKAALKLLEAYKAERANLSPVLSNAARERIVEMVDSWCETKAKRHELATTWRCGQELAGWQEGV